MTQEFVCMTIQWSSMEGGSRRHLILAGVGGMCMLTEQRERQASSLCLFWELAVQRGMRHPSLLRAWWFDI